MRSSTSRWVAASWSFWVTLAVAGSAGCGSVHAEHDAGPPADAHLVADAAEVADAGRADAAPPPRGQEIVTGGGHMSGATFQMDVQVGHPYDQQPTSGATQTLQGNAVVKP